MQTYTIDLEHHMKRDISVKGILAASGKLMYGEEDPPAAVEVRSPRIP